MSVLTIYAGGKLKPPFDALCNLYVKRLSPLKISVKEMEEKQWKSLVKLKSQRWIMWDEKGIQFTSSEFWKKLDTLSPYHICFFIGESFGIPKNIFNQNDEIWSFGLMTWPHLFARAMLLEQLYRKILAQKGHPYSFV
ncbi:23S rRNA (pseudouridine(1915)-N(3))-methyltransferase RlmH [Holospora elegans]|nr:23S rRNA (pseudouridine(1915)-N(3))-methyltransferase RlmH [Holospora elegans]